MVLKRCYWYLDVRTGTFRNGMEIVEYSIIEVYFFNVVETVPKAYPYKEYIVYLYVVI